METDDPEETARTIADLVLAAVRAADPAAETFSSRMGPFARGHAGGGLPGRPDLPGGPACPDSAYPRSGIEHDLPRMRSTTDET